MFLFIGMLLFNTLMQNQLYWNCEWMTNSIGVHKAMCSTLHIQYVGNEIITPFYLIIIVNNQTIFYSYNITGQLQSFLEFVLFNLFVVRHPHSDRAYLQWVITLSSFTLLMRRVLLIFLLKISQITLVNLKRVLR